jgi:hypothetical protein
VITARYGICLRYWPDTGRLTIPGSRGKDAAGDEEIAVVLYEEAQALVGRVGGLAARIHQVLMGRSRVRGLWQFRANAPGHFEGEGRQEVEKTLRFFVTLRRFFLSLLH